MCVRLAQKLGQVGAQNEEYLEVFILTRVFILQFEAGFQLGIGSVRSR